jgi:hypothetical protein
VGRRARVPQGIRDLEWISAGKDGLDRNGPPLRPRGKMEVNGAVNEIDRVRVSSVPVQSLRLLGFLAKV